MSNHTNFKPHLFESHLFESQLIKEIEKTRKNILLTCIAKLTIIICLSVFAFFLANSEILSTVFIICTAISLSLFFTTRLFSIITEHYLYTYNEKVWITKTYHDLYNLRKDIDKDVLNDSLKMQLSDLRLITLKHGYDGYYKEFEVDQEFDAALFLKRKSLPLEDMLKIQKSNE